MEAHGHAHSSTAAVSARRLRPAGLLTCDQKNQTMVSVQILAGQGNPCPHTPSRHISAIRLVQAVPLRVNRGTPVCKPYAAGASKNKAFSAIPADESARNCLAAKRTQSALLQRRTPAGGSPASGGHRYA